MRADKLFKALGYPSPFPKTEITAITEDSRTATAQSIFVCIKGVHFDGHAKAIDAYQRGCRVYVAERPLNLPRDAYVAILPDTRRALAILADAFYGHPSRHLHVIGITGTKGKTTTAYLISHILNESGIPCGYIGTNGICYANITNTVRNTTPDAVTLQKTLSDMLLQGIKAVALEVSSQALMQHRIAGVQFGTVLFTNLSPDHVGEHEHPTFEAYRAAKHTLFTSFPAKNAVWNLDDPATSLMRDGARASGHFTFSAMQDADLTASDILPYWENNTPGIRFTLLQKGEKIPVTLPLLGLCNVSNALAALTVATDVFSIPRTTAARALSTARVPGRSECIMLPNGAAAVIDYAHNEESLYQILTTLRAYHPRRLICLFGSVGERSQMRRRELGAVAAKWADHAILTSDNPGTEDPEAIIREIAAAFEGTSTPYLSIPDRAEAIQRAVSMTSPGDILLLAGKGHETYQLIGREKLPFCERELVISAAKKLALLQT